MKRKQVLSILLLIGLIFMSGMGLLPVYAADEWQNVYEAYGINPNDPNAVSVLSEMMSENPPQAIVIKLDNFAAPSGSPIVPLNEEVMVELGKSATVATSFEWEDDYFRLAYKVDLTVRYERVKDHETAAMLLWASQAYVKGSRETYIPEAHEEQWIEVTGDTYVREANVAGFLSGGHHSIPLTPKSRSEESSKNLPLNLGAISYQIDRVMIKSGGLSSVIDTDASGTAGDTSASVAAAIVIGLLGLAAAAAGAGSAAGSSADEASRDEESPSYQMVIGKDFGDALKSGKKQRVWARMVELKNGAPVDRPDLTAGISIFSSEVLVGASSLRGENVEAEVQIQENAPPEGVISFLYSGEHGTFQNNVRFRLLGNGEIRLASDKVNILSTDANPFELVYELKNFTEEEPPLEITASSGFVALDMGKNDKQQTVILITPGPDADPWDRKSFTKICRCEMTAMDGKLPVKAVFEVNVCFEGIGTSYIGIPSNKIPPDEDILYCDPDSNRRYDKGVWLPLAVMKWDEKARNLKHDTSLSETLQFDFELDKVTVSYNDPEILSRAQSSFDEVQLRRERTTRPRPAEHKTEVDSKNNPLTYVLYAENDTAGSADPLPISVTISAPDPDIESLSLLMKIQFSNNLREYIKRFFAYSENTFAYTFATYGRASNYLAAMDFIEDHVYMVSNAPFSLRMTENYYEDAESYEGVTDWLSNPRGGGRHRAVILKDDSYPKHGNDMKKIQSLIHELTHAIEHMNGSTGEDGGERHSYFLQYASDAFHRLAEIERGVHTDLQTALGYVIEKLYITYNNKDNTDEPRQLSWFGANMPQTQHHFINKYIQELTSYAGSGLSQEQRQQVADVLASIYFPLDIRGYYREETGPFKGTVWSVNWMEGYLLKIVTNDTDSHFVRIVGSPRWLGGNKAVLRLQVEVSRKGKVNFEALKTSSQEMFDVELASASDDTYDMNDSKYAKKDDLVIRWYPRTGIANSMLYGTTSGNYLVSPLTPCSRPSTFDITKESIGPR